MTLTHTYGPRQPDRWGPLEAEAPDAHRAPPRRLAALTLKSIGAQEAIPALEQRLRDGDESVARTAGEAIAWLRSAAAAQRQASDADEQVAGRVVHRQ